MVYTVIMAQKFICGFFTCFNDEKIPQNNFSCQNISVENNYFQIATATCSSTHGKLTTQWINKNCSQFFLTQWIVKYVKH